MARIRALLGGLLIALFGLVAWPGTVDDETTEEAYRRLWKRRDG